MLSSFVDFLRNKNPLSEMAVPYDIVKKPIKLDAEEIQYLKQFPVEFWKDALYQRHNKDLLEALSERHQRRKLVYDKIYPEMYERALAEPHIKGNKKLAKKRAEYLAETEAEKAEPHVNYPNMEQGIPEGYKRYYFKPHRSSKTKMTIIAKPMINRLIHKIERTKGEAHHHESGLHELGVSHGEYGYDLHDPKPGKGNLPGSTRGMQAVNDDQVGTRLASLINHNSHRMYGHLHGDQGEKDENIKWMPTEYGRTAYHDHWTVRKLLDPLEAKYFRELDSMAGERKPDPNGDIITPNRVDSNDKKRKLAHWLAYTDMIKMAEKGELKSPPTPKHPEGIPITVNVKEDGSKVLVVPPVHLPHKMGSYFVEENGKIIKKRHWEPQINPAEYLRRLGDDESDEDITEDDPRIRGHQKDYIAEPEYKKGYLAGGAFHVTHNSTGRKFLDESDPNYKRRLQEVELGMGKVNLDARNKPMSKEPQEDGDFFFDLIKGIWNGINSHSGGQTQFEYDILVSEVPDLHSLAYMRVIDNLRGEEILSSKFRRELAKNVVGEQAQQELGGGSRRKRKLTQTARQTSLDKTTSGKDGGEVGISDKIQFQMQGARASDFGGNLQLKQGEKSREGYAQRQFPYHIDRLREMIQQAESQAVNSDTNKQQAQQDNNAELMKGAISDKSAALMAVTNVLRGEYENARAVGMQEFKDLSDDEINKLIADKLSQYTQNNPPTEEIVARFKKDFEVLASSVKQGQENTTPMTDTPDRDALDRFNNLISQIPAEKLQEPATRQKLTAYVSGNPTLEKALARVYGAREQQPAMAARQIQQKPDKEVLDDLIKQKKWLDVANNPFFRKNALLSNLQQVLKLLTAQSANLDPDDYELAVYRLNKAIEGKAKSAPSPIEAPKQPPKPVIQPKSNLAQPKNVQGTLF